MIIELASIGTNSKEIELQFDPGDIDLEGELVSLTSETILTGETRREGDRATVQGTIRTDVSIDCARCLEPLARHFDIPFRAIFIDSSGEDTNAEAEIGEDQLDESLVEGGRIDMAEVVREQILLAVPVQVFCREDCKGLCPKCGENLNLIDCKCADDEIDPRWAALKGLK